CPVASWCAWRVRSAAAGDGGAGRVNGSRRQGRFEGSFRQVRGGVLRVLREGPATDVSIGAALKKDVDDVRRAVDALASEGAVEADGGDGTGSGDRVVRLAEG